MAFARRHPALSTLIVAAAVASLAAAAHGQAGAPSSTPTATPAGSASSASPFGALDLSIAPSEGRSSDENRPATPSPVTPAAPEGGVALPPEARSVSPTPAVTTPARLSPAPAVNQEQARALTTRAHNAMANGDIAGARALLTAAGRDPEAERMLAEAWDPDVLARLGVVGIEGDAGKARALYGRAAADAGTPPQAQ